MKKTIGIILLGATLFLAVNAFAQTPPPDNQGAEYVIHDDVAPIQKKIATKHKKHTSKKHTKKKHGKKTAHSSAHSHMRVAQDYLQRLGYDPGPEDGLLGRRTKAALKKFQADHGLRVTGTLTDATFRALEKATGARPSAFEGNMSHGESSLGNLVEEGSHPDFLSTHPDFYGYYGTEGIDPNAMGTPQTIPSRFGNVAISEAQNGSTYSYTVTLNGQTVFSANNQPSFVNVSRTFNLDDADAVLITFYGDNDSVCPYRHNLLVMRGSGSGVRNIANCSRDYDAYSESGMLLISFPGGHVDGWSSGDSWRYDHGSLERL